MRDEYLYETKDLKKDTNTGEWKEVEYAKVCARSDELREKYGGLYEKIDMPYYIPWLSMFAGHESKTGEKVELQVKVEIIDPGWEESKVRFECPPGMRVIPEEVRLTVKDTIGQNEKGKREGIYATTKVTVICDKEHAGCEITAMALSGKEGPADTVVGKLNVFPNKEYPLNIRIVKLLREECLETDRDFIDRRIGPVISYLKNKSLLQAMIVPQIEEGDCMEMVISEKEWVNGGKLIGDANGENLVLSHSDHVFRLYKDMHELQEEEQTCKEYELYDEYKEVLGRDEYKDYKIVKNTLRYKDGKKRVIAHKRFKGIVLILSNIEHAMGGVGGTGKPHPTQENACFITRTGLTDKPIFPGEPQKYYPCISHEIGHTLGLDHVFENTLNKSEEEYKKSKKESVKHPPELMSEQETKIVEIKRSQDKEIKEKEQFAKMKDMEKEAQCQNQIDSYTKDLKEFSKYIIGHKENMPAHEQEVESYEWLRDILGNRCYQYEKGSTDNMMDYYLLGSKFKMTCTFFHWQWEKMQKDLTRFHS